MEDAGITPEKGKHGFHLLMHSAATLLYKKSRDPKALQNLLWHTKIPTTMDTYGHVEREVASEGLSLLVEGFLPNCDLTVTEKSEMVN